MQAIEQPAPSDPIKNVPSRQSGTRACAMCVKAKAKCLPQPEREGICQRCDRLKKQCFPQERPRRKRTRTSKTTRVAQLEQKLDGLVTLLTSNQSGLQADPSVQMASGLLPRSPVSLDSNASTSGPSTTIPSSDILITSTTIMKSANRCTAGDVLVRGSATKSLFVEPDEQEAEIMLFEFKANMAEQFPFVVIHPDSTSQTVAHERPLLWKAIMVAASHGNSDRQLALGAELTKDLTTRLLFRAEKSLDLLQALLVFIAWYHYHTLVNPQITNLLHLAKALINNMGLHRAQTVYDRGRFFLDGSDHTKAGTLWSYELGSSSSDGWRALAGCFYVASALSASCRGLELQFNTPYILECCQKLEEAEEYQSDDVLVQLTRLQEIRYRMGRSFPYDDSHASAKSDAPIEMIVRAWQVELESFWASLPIESQHNQLLLTNYHTAKIALYEIDMGASPSCLPRNMLIFIDRTGSLEFICASLLATKKVFDVYSSVPVERLSGICLMLWTQFSHALLNGIKLLTSEADGWDLQHARSFLTFPNILHNQVKGIEEVITRRGLSLESAMDGKDVFARLLMKAHQALRWYESSRVSKVEPQGLSNQPTEPHGSVETAETGEPLPVFDDAFWQNLFDDNWMLAGDGFST